MENALQIEQIAKDLNEEALQAFEWVDYRAGRYPTVAAKLAYEQQHQAVELLTKYNADIALIAFAYALSGNDEKVEQYRQLAIKYPMNIDKDILIGYAAAGNHEQASFYNTFVDDSSYLIQGYALGGHHDLVEKHIKYLNDIAQAYVSGGRHDLAEAQKIKISKCVSEIALAYALADFHDKVEQYRQYYGASVNVIAWGYAKRGHHAEVRKYVTLYGASINCIAHGYAYSGNHRWVDIYRGEGASIYAVAMGYADANNRKKVAEYLALGADLDVLIRYCIDMGLDVLVREFLCQRTSNLLTIAECYKKSGQEDKAYEYELLHRKDELSLIEYYYKHGALLRMKEYITSYLQPKPTTAFSYLVSLLFQPLIQDPQNALIATFIRQLEFIDSIEHVEAWVDIWKKQEEIKDWTDLPEGIQKILTRCEIPFDINNELSLQVKLT